jgi:hypothetical protein
MITILVKNPLATLSTINSQLSTTLVPALYLDWELSIIPQSFVFQEAKTQHQT